MNEGRDSTAEEQAEAFYRALRRRRPHITEEEHVAMRKGRAESARSRQRARNFEEHRLTERILRGYQVYRGE